MHDSLLVELAKSQYDLRCVKFDHMFWEPLLGLKYFVKLSTADERHNEVKPCFGLE
jgi:hypothetical protein